uniref:Uncharacterized protein n=1 Tax=Arundo donax TaxID=35708 RepID=A0A0A9E1L8_ARUDO
MYYAPYDYNKSTINNSSAKSETLNNILNKITTLAVFL